MTTEVRRGQQKTREGIVVSDRMDKTVVVVVERVVQHPKYKKRVRRRARVKAHDPRNECRVGDRVLIRETRPLSREKRWAVSRILERAQ
ncbi:MAG: 30S ribosomal protein S17 [Candidatus Binatia bacterium]|nr:30S ribosomal protein S17 [Candidatus Binatia bacterium]